jgi:TPR repeat protein
MCREFPWTGQDVSDGNRGDIPLVEAHAEKGNKDAMYNLAYRYVNGIQAPRDVIRGLDMYHMAAVAGHYHACRELGDMYLYGKNVMKNAEKGVRLYIAGIRLGDPISLYKYGKIRSLMKENKVEGVPDDLPKKCFLKSASAGYKPALDKVKDLYTTNDVTKQEYSDALRSYQSVYDEMNSEARKRFLKRRANNSALLDDESDGLKKIAGIMKTIQSREI